MNFYIRLIVTFIAMIYIFHIVFNVHYDTIANERIKKVLYNPIFMYIAISFIITGLMEWYDKTWDTIFKLIGFLLLISFVLIDI